ncbi:nucleotide exchange factor GrpE [Lutibacter sp. TH_r2]|uniref:nucleotide exchange factor GrpE n=1 Tax=Lutibacter sp. TH_r2 TaxID=3082083 RepID=UPI002955B6BF|nr:nucleotide exchange factor GrpE [Lutibacter sp. TH_r2]MDV7187550.1 nucleotide exchange factor GrpE [Lutibacter sp. TH_r2]
MSKKENTKPAQDEVQEQDINQEETLNDTPEVSKEEQLEKDLAQEKDKFLRLFAEFENYKRRTAKERVELFKTANEDLMTVLLPILDDFDRGLSEIKKAKDKELLKGMELIKNKLSNSLTQKGLSTIEVKQGDVFDVELHEAITQIPAPSDKLKGKIIDVIERGYKLGDKVIRYPKVVVGQ